jgi:hypothetical protein
MCKFNVLTLNPRLPHLIPANLRDQLDIEDQDDIDDTYRSKAQKRLRQDNLERLEDPNDEDQSPLAIRLRRDMQRDALTSPNQQEDEFLDEEGPRAMGVSAKGRSSGLADDDQFTEETIQEAKSFLQLPVCRILLDLCALLTFNRYRIA